MTLPTFIRHRANSIDELAKIELDWGVEIDLRSDVSSSGKIHLSHDPWIRGDDFEEWLKVFSDLKIKGPIILNTKEDGLEQKVIELLKQYDISSYFFLDTTLPTLVRWTIINSLKNFSVRYSQFEPEILAKKFANKANWLWVDCFNGTPPDIKPLLKLKKAFLICLVSPELQGVQSIDWDSFSDLFKLADAICTKNPKQWIRNSSQRK